MPLGDARLCALAVHQLVRELPTNSAPASDTTVLRRCGLAAISDLDLATVSQSLRFLVHNNDASVVSLLFPGVSMSAQTMTVLGISDLWKNWVEPMSAFCASHGRGSDAQRQQVSELLCRCGWETEVQALQLVLEELEWDTIEVLHFALGLLRRHHEQLWLPLAQALEAPDRKPAFLPLRKLLDPDLTLVLVTAAPELVGHLKERKNGRPSDESESFFAASHDP